MSAHFNLLMELTILDFRELDGFHGGLDVSFGIDSFLS